jgi:mono/diheme cytochrome c family protein
MPPPLMLDTTTLRRIAAVLCAGTLSLPAQSEIQDAPSSLDEIRRQGAQKSRYLAPEAGMPEPDAASGPDLEGFARDIEPILRRSCYECHGPDEDEGGVRLDEMDPDFFAGEDVDWWLDVLAVLTNGEMPPTDGLKLADEDRARVIDWLSLETQRASTNRRASRAHSSFRRLTRYEYDYALQDLLGVSYDFAADLPPDPASEDGFRNSSETLHIAGSQLRTYLDAGRRALELATVTGDRPTPLQWSVSMRDLATREWNGQDQQLDKVRKQHEGDLAKAQEEVDKLLARFRNPPGGTWFEDAASGRKARQSWGYNGASYARKPSEELVDLPAPSDHVAVVTPNSSLIVELGDRVPERGPLRVRFRASRADGDGRAPRVRLMFGWQASNDSRSLIEVSEEDVVVDAPPDAPAVYTFEVPISRIYPRNLVRGVNKLGDLPSPSEYIRLAHTGGTSSPVRIDHVEITAPAYDTWPPASHTRIFPDRKPNEGEQKYARRVLEGFLPRAWRRSVTKQEITQKLALFRRVRAECESLQEALAEVLATTLASPNFLYVTASDRKEGQAEGAAPLTDAELATRLAVFLWCSVPDDELLALAAEERLHEPEVLAAQVARMRADPRARRFAHHFVHQWLNLELLEFLQVDRKLYRNFDAKLKAAMLAEPVAFFDELLRADRSVLDVVHADFAVVNERLAAHYGFEGVEGDDFRVVPVPANAPRGGLLTQAGILAMNSNGEDSHPIKRAVWLMERILNDPPPPPPPAVPEIDLADPEIAKMTLKQRLEDHRNHAACMSCHSKIDPWGFAFENFDAVGAWRSEVRGQPVDASGTLFNGQTLDGVDGLKRFLLGDRQDQFVRGMVEKLATFALGRPLVFEDRAALDRITAEVRRNGDGLATIVTTLVQSDLFRSR